MLHELPNFKKVQYITNLAFKYYFCLHLLSKQTIIS